MLFAYLVGGDSDECRDWEGGGVEDAELDGQKVTGLHHVHARKVLVHRRQDDLENNKGFLLKLSYLQALK